MSTIGETALRDLPSQTTGDKAPAVDVDQFLAELKNAASTGATDLPSAAIPTSTAQQMDERAVVNNVPGETQKYSIAQTVSPAPAEANSRHVTHAESSDKLDIWALPLLSGLLYVLAQQPAVRKQLITWMPSATTSSGELSLQGMLVMSGVIGGIVYGVQEYVLVNRIN